MPSERLETQRLILRPPALDDVPAFVPLIGDYEIAKNLASAPHPYSESDGRAFVARVTDARAKGVNHVFAVVRKNDSAFVGACGVHPERGWEFGYWIGKPYWGNGYATEAAHRLVDFVFEELDTDVLNAGWFEDNPASSRVLTKLGCRPTVVQLHECAARGTPVPCNRVVLTRAMWRARRAA